jgi:hypothetical protein
VKGKSIVSAPRLNVLAIDKAVRILDSWSGKLTWDRYLDELSRILGHRYTKVAMLNRPRIAEAWKLAKLRLPTGQIHFEDSALSRANRQIDSLKNENERLELENDRLKEQFLRWQYNAYQLKGLTIDHLDQPLLPVDRAVTRHVKMQKGRKKAEGKSRR